MAFYSGMGGGMGAGIGGAPSASAFGTQAMNPYALAMLAQMQNGGQPNAPATGMPSPLGGPQMPAPPSGMGAGGMMGAPPATPGPQQQDLLKMLMSMGGAGGTAGAGGLGGLLGMLKGSGGPATAATPGAPPVGGFPINNWLSSLFGGGVPGGAPT